MEVGKKPSPNTLAMRAHLAMPRAYSRLCTRGSPLDGMWGTWNRAWVSHMHYKQLSQKYHGSGHE